MEWKEVRLGDYIEFNPKRSLKKSTIAKKVTMDLLVPYSKQIYKYIVEPYNGGAKFQNGDTIMARITPCLENGKHSYVNFLEEDEIAFGSTEYIVMCGKPNITDNEFVYYFSHTPFFKNTAIKSMVGTSGRQRAQVDVLTELCVNFPVNIADQKKIADLLSSLDAKIETNNRLSEKLEELAQAIFKSWFVDFEPFKNQKFHETELGMIPEGWEVGNLLDIAELYDSQRKPLSSRERNNMEKIYPYYGATSIMDYVDNYIFDGTYLLMGEDGSVVNDKGYPYLQYVFGKFWPNNHAHVMQGKNGFTTEMLHCILLKRNISQFVTGAVQAKLSQSNMRKIEIVIPDKEVLESFSSLIAPLYNKIKGIVVENRNLSNLRDTLLPRLMSGEIKL